MSKFKNEEEYLAWMGEYLTRGKNKTTQEKSKFKNEEEYLVWKKRIIRSILLGFLGGFIVVYWFGIKPYREALNENRQVAEKTREEAEKIRLKIVELVQEQEAEKEMQKIKEQVAADCVDQYIIAKRQGDPIQICVQAGLVATAYLQSKDEVNYRKWKNIQWNDCRRAGIPQ